MWFNILPAYLIVTAGLGLPGLGLWWIHYAIVGNHYRRGLLERWDRAMYLRDLRVSGNVYKVNGLEQIPDME